MAGRKLEKMLKYGQIILVVATSLYFISFFSYLFCEKFRKDRYDTPVPKTLAWSSFVVFCLMAVTNTMLFIQVRRQNNLDFCGKRELRKEVCTLLTIMIFFELNFMFEVA